MAKITEPKIRSNYIKNKIKGKSFKERSSKYFDDLIFIEEWVTGKAWGMGASMNWAQHIRDKYPKEIKEIWTELNPVRYKSYLKQQAKDRKELEQLDKDVEKQDKEELEAMKKQWVQAGGTLQ